jgi:hypothetical protein
VAPTNNKGIITLRWRDEIRNDKRVRSIRIEFSVDFIKENPEVDICQRNIVQLNNNAIFITLFERVPNMVTSYKITQRGNTTACSLPMELWNFNLQPQAQYFINKILPLLKEKGSLQFTPLFWDSDKNKGIYRYALDASLE